MWAKYIIRLDDAHPCMEHDRWKKIESICIKYNIQPIVAVIPDNQDKDLNYSAINNKFWKELSDKQYKGWAIALHGYQHKLNPSSGGLIPINRYSEFTGVSVEEQSDMIEKGCKILQKHNLVPSVWVAPAHGFDKNTIKSLVKSTNICVISDGLSIRPFRRFNINWIPQQLWRAREMWFGTWTICLHPSEMTLAQMELLSKFLEKNSKHVVNINSLFFVKFSIVDYVFHLFFIFILIVKKVFFILFRK